jgi:nuclear pore complex protein Nup98-Nup96
VIGFGASATSSPFGQNKPAFGSTATTSSGGLFGGGSTTATSGSTFGGFGGTSSTPAFGSGAGTSTGGLFGQSKPAFGTTTSGGLFGSGGGSSSGFGTSGTSTGFGANATPAFGGGANNATNEGTGKVPFSEMTEKDPSATNTTNRYQTITTIDPYKNFSLEELRLVDYAQGRKYGNQNGQAGAFGTSTGFGGFGSTTTPASTGFGTAAGTTSGGLFGGANTSTGFGQQPATTSTGFGSGTTGGLFGAKPATGGGLFGNTTTTTTQPSGGLFGGAGGTGFGSGTTSTGFGSGTTTGGLFGSTAAKPATGFGGFGSGTATSAAGTGTGFGASTGFGSTAPASGGGLFGGGSGTTTSAFGTQQQPAATGGFSFGQQNQQAQPAQTSGGLFGGGGGGAFGQQNQQQKTGGLFGSTTTATGGGLFGQPAQQQQSTGGGLFGGGTQQQSTGGLFGAKPATGGLFGSSTTGTTGGLFGGSQPQQTQTSGGLFGGSQQQSGGLFGSKPATTGLGSSLFGGGQNQQQQSTTGGLFGGSQQQQPAMGSLFGGSQQQQQPQQPQALTANLLQNPYGNDALFANIGTPTQSVGPIATPLSTSQKNKKPAMIPSYRLNPNASSRLLTPQKRPAGYGFSYSTYGTPGSAISNASPLGLGNSLLSASSYGRSLNKSMSTSNLRSSFSAEDSILNPGAFAGTSRGGTGSLKKLNINKNLNVRRSLFGPDAHTPEPRKSVSFEASNKDVNSSSSLFGPSNGQLVRTESPPAEPSVTIPNRADPVPEMAQVNGVSRGKELAIVPENGSPVPHGAPAAEVPLSQKDKVTGDYYMNPSEQEIARMSRDEKANVKNFTVGRQGCGKIVFSKVNLNEVNIQDICDKIVQIQTRQATVYGDELVAKKPPRGQGLNVPSLITLENSWPRSAAGLLPVHEKKGLRYEKHIKRLKRVTDTNFVSYNDKTGEWTFSVEHFTTYGFPEDDEDESMMESSILEEVMDEAPGTPTPSKYSSKAILPHVSPPFTSDSSLPSPPESSPDDTFDFKKGPRKHLPGQFSDEDLGDVNMVEDDDEVTDTAQSFLGERSVGSLEDDNMSQASESGTVEDQEMAGSFPKPAHTTEQSAASHTMNGEALKPKSILKASQTVSFGTPLKTGQLLFGADWAEQLQRTVSPKKQDRAALRANQPIASTQLDTEPKPKPVQNDKPFTNSIDLINELFSRSAAGRKTLPAKFGDSSRDFEVRV